MGIGLFSIFDQWKMNRILEFPSNGCTIVWRCNRKRQKRCSRLWGVKYIHYTITTYWGGRARISRAKPNWDISIFELQPSWVFLIFSFFFTSFFLSFLLLPIFEPEHQSFFKKKKRYALQQPKIKKSFENAKEIQKKKVFRFSSWKEKVTSRAKLKILQFELWLEPARLGLITKSINYLLTGLKNFLFHIFRWCKLLLFIILANPR